jgi:hypothetical protein
MGVFLKRLIRSDRTFEYHTGPLHRCGNDLGIVHFFSKTMMERFELEPQASSAAFIDGAAIARSKKPTDV